MDNISNYINEALLSREKTNAISKSKDPDDPNTWEVGDVIYGHYGHIVTLPRFYRITKLRRNDFSVVRLKGKIIEGSKEKHEWTETATDEIYSDKELKGKINKKDEVKVGDIIVRFWTGRPVKGYDKI